MLRCKQISFLFVKCREILNKKNATWCRNTSAQTAARTFRCFIQGWAPTNLTSCENVCLFHHLLERFVLKKFSSNSSACLEKLVSLQLKSVKPLAYPFKSSIYEIIHFTAIIVLHFYILSNCPFLISRFTKERINSLEF